MLLNKETNLRPKFQHNIIGVTLSARYKLCVNRWSKLVSGQLVGLQFFATKVPDNITCYLSVCVCVCVYIYIYIYIYTPK